MQQLKVIDVELYPFRVQKLAIGQIAYNEDNSTAIMTPFSGRVTRMIAKIGDKVKRGETLFEIDSPEVVRPQNDFIAIVTARNKSRSQLDLAQIVEKRLKDLYEGKAAPLKEWQQAEAQLVGAQNDMRSAEIAVEAAQARLRIVGLADEEIAALGKRHHQAFDVDFSLQSTAPSSPARSGWANMCATTTATRSTPSPTSRPCGSRRSCPRATSRSSASARRWRSGSARSRNGYSRRASRLSLPPPTR